ncbi:response regulator transcription factor [Aliikangiella coralliicola]|uniref:Phosphate regulon transcriptional regulatory protein PhoB n=1 Tax=Aliikangiella coralliicola TaxID=2592383 RepID=A0A545UBA9_9GAMM|nr:response regulator transcription factor [Aliikangiella coralliicola]
MKQRVLIVEDDPDIAELLKVNLQDMSLSCEICTRGDKAIPIILANQFALIILDLMLPGMSGVEICQEIRKSKPEQAILMLTAKSSELDQILGLEVGADDYMTKPFSIPALQARVKVQLRRCQLYQESLEQVSRHAQPQKIVIGDLSVDPTERRVNLRHVNIDLTALEFDLLKFFATRPEQVFSRTQLLDQVWGYDHAGYEHTVNSNINRLRNKLQAVAGSKQIIQTVWGVGYRLSATNCTLSQEVE